MESEKLPNHLSVFMLILSALFFGLGLFVSLALIATGKALTTDLIAPYAIVSFGMFTAWGVLKFVFKVFEEGDHGRSD